jgi:hypothetical protein
VSPHSLYGIAARDGDSRRCLAVRPPDFALLPRDAGSLSEWFAGRGFHLLCAQKRYAGTAFAISGDSVAPSVRAATEASNDERPRCAASWAMLRC